jgi:hypothetical protein
VQEEEIGWRRGMTDGAGRSEREGAASVPVRAGELLGRGRMVSPGLLSIFFFSFFLFLNFDLFQILCKFGSNQFKQISKFP